MLLKRRLLAARTRLKLKAQEGALTISPQVEEVPEPIEDMRRSTAQAGEQLTEGRMSESGSRRVQWC